MLSSLAENVNKASGGRRRTEIPSSAPAGLTAEFAGQADKIVQWKAFLARSRLDVGSAEFAQVIRDLGKGILVGSALTLTGLWLAGQALSWGVAAFGLSSLADVAAMPLLALALGAFELVTMPLNNGYSRWRESLADRYSLEAARKSEAFASAMTRLANQNLSEADPERWVEVLLYSHPAISRRVAMAREFSFET